MNQNGKTFMQGKKKISYATAPTLVTAVNAGIVAAVANNAFILPSDPSTGDYISIIVKFLGFFLPSIIAWSSGTSALKQENKRDIERVKDDTEITKKQQETYVELEKVKVKERENELKQDTDRMSLEEYHTKIVLPAVKVRFGVVNSSTIFYTAYEKMRFINPTWERGYLLGLAKKAFLDTVGISYDDLLKGIEAGTIEGCQGQWDIDGYTMEKGMPAYSIWKELERLLNN